MGRRWISYCAASWFACCGALTLAQSPPSIPARRTEARLEHPRSLRLASLRDEATRPAPVPAGRTAPLDASGDGLAQIASLSVRTLGPREVILGKPATYIVVVENTDRVTARDVVISIKLPGELEAVIDDVSSGQAQKANEEDAAELVWQIPQLLSHAREQLRLTVTSADPQPFGLEISSRCAAGTQIEVLEPALEVALTGPEDVVFNHDAKMTLVVHNPGTGPAENVTVELTPSAPDTAPVQLGTLAAGEQRQMEFAIPASVAGVHRLRATANGDRGLKHEATHTLLVRRAEVEFEVTGPETEYAGTTLEYQVSCINVGNAPAEEIRAVCSLPEGLKYIGGIEGASQQGSVLSWTVNDLEPGQQHSFAFECLAEQSGQKEIQIAATGDAAMRPITGMVTEVRAVADLKLAIHDTPTPRAVGEDTELEIRISNRGTESARDVRVVAHCAADVMPTDVSGNAVIENGSVYFQPVPELAPGKTAVLKVNARGHKSGTFPFRVEVECDEPETRLVAEETVRFFTRKKAESRK